MKNIQQNILRRKLKKENEKEIEKWTYVGKYWEEREERVKSKQASS